MHKHARIRGTYGYWYTPHCSCARARHAHTLHTVQYIVTRTHAHTITEHTRTTPHPAARRGVGGRVGLPRVIVITRPRPGRVVAVPVVFDRIARLDAHRGPACRLRARALLTTIVKEPHKEATHGQEQEKPHPSTAHRGRKPCFTK